MNPENNQKMSLKQKAAHEFEEFAVIFLYLAFFFCAISTYSMVLLDKFHLSYFGYGTALINALVIAKVILIGEYAHVGKRLENKSLLLSAIYKALLFGLLVFGFHIIEEVIKRLIHGDTIVRASHEMRIDDLLCRSLVVFCTFISLFAFRELRRVMGDEDFRALFFRGRTPAKADHA